jgi:hypothetical protein
VERVVPDNESDINQIISDALRRARQIESDNTYDSTEFQKSVNRALQQALTEWMNDKFSAFGKWTLTGLLVAGLSAVVWLIFKSNGFLK